MRKKQIFLILLLSLIVINKSLSQTYSRVYGSISQAEAGLTVYEKDKSAEAIVLYDAGKSYFVESGNSFNVVFERSTRIKILTEAGLDWAEIEIPIYHEGNVFEVIDELDACTYNMRGGRLEKTPLSKEGIHDERINNFWTARKFAMPDVKPGSIIEYKYKIISQYKFNLRDWEFQWRIPVLYSEYEVNMIPFYEYSWLLQGATRFSSQTSAEDTGVPRRFGAIDFRDMVHKYIMKDVPAFHDEEFTSSINDYIIKIDFQLSKVYSMNGVAVNIITTWPELIKDMLKNDSFGKYVEKADKASSRLFDSDTLKGKTEQQKLDKIIAFVKSNFSWNSDESKYASGNPGDLIKNKTGNSADINLLAVGLLNSVGIEAYPVLISTRENGKIKSDYPYSRFFNYVIILANVNGKNVLSDATEVHIANDRIPTRCINDKGLVIKKDEVQWVSLQSNYISTLHTTFSLGNLSDKGEATITMVANEYDAAKLRKLLGTDTRKIDEMIKDEDYAIDESSLSVKNLTAVSKPLTLAFRLSFDTEKINEKIYVSPFLNVSISDNPLKQTSRSYPIDMIHPVKRAYISTINIPEGYKADFVPDNFTVNNNFFELNYNVLSDEKKIVVSFDYYFKMPVYVQYEYLSIKQFFNDIIRKGGERIVLSKK